MTGHRWKTSYDTAKRASDIIALHQAALSQDEILAGRFVAIRLADGGSDGVIYDTRKAAIDHQRNDASRHAYFQVPLERWNPQTIDVLLWYTRKAYDNGHREDPAFQLYIPNQVEFLHGQH